MMRLPAPRMASLGIAAVTLVLLACVPAATLAQAPARLSNAEFAALSARLSEPGGYFDTDNLISNEDSYLHAVSQLRAVRAEGGTYVGVGPDQNFSYIAAIRPNVAFIVDIRRDNLLAHLLFRSIFALSRNRADYLALLFGRAPPRDTAGWGAKPADSLLAWVERAPRDSAGAARVLASVRGSPLRVAAADAATVARFHAAFIADGPSLRFNTFGRAPAPYYPDFRRLALERDREGNRVSFLANEEAFRIVKDLEDRNLVIPVVGNFGGAHALAALADWMRGNGEALTVFYASNVEQYLFRDGGFARFAAALAALPRAPNAVIIRSCFVCFSHPAGLAGYHAVQIVQPVSRFAELSAAGRLRSYSSLLSLGNLEP